MRLAGLVWGLYHEASGASVGASVMRQAGLVWGASVMRLAGLVWGLVS